MIKLKYEYYKNVLFNATYITLQMNRIQGKIKETYRINKVFFVLLRWQKNIYLKMDKVGYQIFINKTY